MSHTLLVPADTDIRTLVTALNLAQTCGIRFSVGPNPHIHWDPTAEQYVATEAAVLDNDFPATWAGGHSLVVEYGDCELHARCQCGEELGSITPDKPIDDLATPWERHVMHLPR